MNRSIVFIGSSALGLLRLGVSPHFSVKGALCLEKRLTPDLTRQAATLKLAVETFSTFREFRLLIGRYPADTLFFIYQLDMLVPADLTETYHFYNVHRGDLMTNRGPNPDVWPILEGHSTTALSLHRIDGQIDAGTLIAAFEVPIEACDDPLTVRRRLELRFDSVVEALAAFLDGSASGRVLEGGTYRPWIREADFTIDLTCDSLDVIDRKIRSQRPYNGAILMDGSLKLYVVGLLEVKPRSGEDVFVAAEAEVVRARSYSNDLVFARNTAPAYPSPPEMPSSARI